MLFSWPPVKCGFADLRIFRITDFSYPRPFVPKNEKSLWRTFVPRERKFLELSFLRPFVPGNFRSRGTKVPGNFRSRDLSFPGTFVPGTFVPWERKFPGTFVPGTFRSQELSFPYLRALVYSSSVGVVIVYDADLNC